MKNTFFLKSFIFSFLYFLLFCSCSFLILIYYDLFSLTYFFKNLFFSFFLFLFIVFIFYDAFINKNYIPLLFIFLIPIFVYLFKNKIIISTLLISITYLSLKNIKINNLIQKIFLQINFKNICFIAIFTIFTFVYIFVKNHSLPTDFEAIFHLDIHTDTSTRLAVSEIFKNYNSVSTGSGSIEFTLSSLYSELFLGSFLWLFNLKSYEFFYWFHYGFFYSILIFLYTFFIQKISHINNKFLDIFIYSILLTFGFFIIKPEQFANLFGNYPFSFGFSILLTMLIIILDQVEKKKIISNQVLVYLTILNFLIIFSKTILVIFSFLFLVFYTFKQKKTLRFKIIFLSFVGFINIVLSYLSLFQFFSDGGTSFFFSQVSLNLTVFTILEILFVLLFIILLNDNFKTNKKNKIIDVKYHRQFSYFLFFCLFFSIIFGIFNFLGPQYFWLKILTILLFIPISSLIIKISISNLFNLDKKYYLSFGILIATTIFLNIYLDKYKSIYNKINFTHQSNVKLFQKSKYQSNSLKNLVFDINQITHNNKNKFIVHIPRNNEKFWNISHGRDCHLSSFIIQDLTGLALISGKRPLTEKCNEALTPDFRIKQINLDDKKLCAYLLRKTNIQKIILLDEKKISINKIIECREKN